MHFHERWKENDNQSMTYTWTKKVHKTEKNNPFTLQDKTHAVCLITCLSSFSPVSLSLLTLYLSISRSHALVRLFVIAEEFVMQIPNEAVRACVRGKRRRGTMRPETVWNACNCFMIVVFLSLSSVLQWIGKWSRKCPKGEMPRKCRVWSEQRSEQCEWTSKRRANDLETLVKILCNFLP